MKKILAITLCICMLITCAPLSFARASSPAPANTDYVANEVIITQSTRTQAAEPLPLLSAEILDTSALTDADVRTLKGTVAYGTDIEALCETLEQREDVLSADPNYIQRIDTVTLPQEAQKTGSEYNAFNWYKDSLGLNDAWVSADTLGSDDVVVAVLDTGVNIAHKEFEGAIWKDAQGNAGYNAMDGSSNVGDTNGHGTNVAGIIAMRANDFGYVGIAPEVKIMPVKVSNAITIGDDAILTGLNYAVENGADVINMSFGSIRVSDTMALAYQRASRKAVVIAAAGNSGYDAAYYPQYPAACSGIVGVMSYGSYRNEDRTNYTIDNSQLSSFSNFDKTGEYYQICAPGVEIEGPAHNSNTAFATKSGTSQASPVVAGAAALYISLHPDATPYQVKQALIEGSDRVITGYGTTDTFHGIDLQNILATPLPAEEPVDLSADALAILNACFNDTITEPVKSDTDAISTISTSLMPDIKDHLAGVFELTGIQRLELKNIGLQNEDLAPLQSTAFPRLFEMNVSGNPDLSAIPFTNLTAPILHDLYIDDCAFQSPDNFENLPSLTTLSAAGNLFETSHRFAALSHLKELLVSDCRLQDVTAFRDFHNLTYLDVSYNYITDISPLSGFHGTYLNISANPLNLGVAQDYVIDILESSLKANDADNVQFYHDELNGDPANTYTPATCFAAQNVTFPRTAQQAVLAPAVSPAAANVNSGCRFATDESLVALDTYSGALTWRSEDFPQSRSFTVDLQPFSAFPTVQSTVKIEAPEVLSFYYENGVYTLLANRTTDKVRIDNYVLLTHTTRDDMHVFYVPHAFPYSDTLTAIPYDSMGAGTGVPIGTKAAEPDTSAKVISFTSDKEEYFTGETAHLTITADSGTRFIKLTDTKLHTDTILSSYTESENKHIFHADIAIENAKNYRFKAYASADGNFGIGAKVLTFTSHLAAESFTLTSDTGCVMYFDGTHECIALQPTFYPVGAYAQEVTYTSSDESVATVDANGTLSAVCYGEGAVFATSEHGLTAVFPFVVSPPNMSDITLTEGYVGEATYLEFYTYGASDIVLKNSDGSDVDIPYVYEDNPSGIDGYDTAWTVALYPDTTEPLQLNVYATDYNGLCAETQYRTVNIRPIEPVQSFSFEDDTYHFVRTDGAVKIALNVVPASSTEYFNWSISDNTVATLKGYENYCILTPKKTGSLTLTASTMIGGEECAKRTTVYFEEGKIYTATAETDNAALYEAFNVSVKTDTSVEYLTLTDSNHLLEEYASYLFFEDTDGYRYWSVPYHFKRESSYITISGGDSIGNLSTSVQLDVSSHMPAADHAVNPPVVRGSAGNTALLNLISLPSRANLPYSAYTVASDDESIATFNLGTVHLLKEGQTTLHCTYGETRWDVPVIIDAPIQSITLPESEITLTEQEGYILHPTVTPESTETLTFTSADESVATVDAAGVITARHEGETVLTVTGESGVSAQLLVRVKSAAVITALSFDKAVYEIGVGEELPYTLTADTAMRNKITYLCSNTNIVGVNQSGTYTALKEGTVTITAVADSGVSTTASVVVTAHRSLALSRPLAACVVGNTLAISLVTYPKGIDADGVWYSDNTRIATVSQSGVVTAKTPGTRNIYFVSDKGEIACTQLIVSELNISRLTTESEITLAIGTSHAIVYSKSSAKASETPRWISQYEAIATVDKNGFVYALSEGETNILARLNNGKVYTVHVTVTAAQVTLTASGNTAAVLKSENILGTTRTFAMDIHLEVTDFHRGTYTFTLTAPHHTTLTIEDAAIFADTDLGQLRLHNGDANGDGVVNLADISLILTGDNFGKAVTAENENLNIFEDESIDIRDVSELLLAANYGGTDETITF